MFLQHDLLCLQCLPGKSDRDGSIDYKWRQYCDGVAKPCPQGAIIVSWRVSAHFRAMAGLLFLKHNPTGVKRGRSRLCFI
ncbi:predicted protein [Brucella pinnipedialis M163/99/10]|uniref:hypothetical protein n=1 Tax=Brucella TaxID=234 RepID=UPI0001B9E95A|nr:MULTISPECIES: hypothetical protein [Brucella]EEY07011.1 predicted protein [Brucella pinnipedialis M163/99/10]